LVGPIAPATQWLRPSRADASAAARRASRAAATLDERSAVEPVLALGHRRRRERVRGDDVGTRREVAVVEFEHGLRPGEHEQVVITGE
jgi:hypothetical protein